MHHLFLADAGVPMICVQWPFMFCALLPVIAIEALIVRHRLHLSNRRSFVAAAKANFFSTLAGVPLAWILMLIVQFTIMRPLLSVVEKKHWLTMCAEFGLAT
jgi:ABC-type sulfate transport system permease component